QEPASRAHLERASRSGRLERPLEYVGPVLEREPAIDTERPAVGEEDVAAGGALTHEFRGAEPILAAVDVGDDAAVPWRDPRTRAQDRSQPLHVQADEQPVDVRPRDWQLVAGAENRVESRVDVAPRRRRCGRRVAAVSAYDSSGRESMFAHRRARAASPPSRAAPRG